MGDFLQITSFQKFENKWIANNLFRELHYPLKQTLLWTRIFKEKGNTQKDIPKTNALVPYIPVPDATGNYKPASSQTEEEQTFLLCITNNCAT